MSQAGLLQRLADGTLDDGLISLEEPTWLRPRAHTRRDGATDEHDLAVVRDGQGRGHEARVDVGDVAALGAGVAIALLTGHGPVGQAAATA